MAWITQTMEMVGTINHHRIALKNIRCLKNDIFVATYAYKDATQPLVESVFLTLEEDSEGAFKLHRVVSAQHCYGFDVVYSIDQRMLP